MGGSDLHIRGRLVMFHIVIELHVLMIAQFFNTLGGDTTATVIAALFFYLSHNPECYTKLAHEIRTTFETSLEIRSGQKLARCQYLRACID